MQWHTPSHYKDAMSWLFLQRPLQLNRCLFHNVHSVSISNLNSMYVLSWGILPPRVSCEVRIKQGWNSTTRNVVLFYNKCMECTHWQRWWEEHKMCPSAILFLLKKTFKEVVFSIITSKVLWQVSEVLIWLQNNKPHGKIIWGRMIYLGCLKSRLILLPVWSVRWFDRHGSQHDHIWQATKTWESTLEQWIVHSYNLMVYLSISCMRNKARSATVW